MEASIIIRKTEQKNVNHFKLVVTSITVYGIVCVSFRYVHVLVQKMAVNADLGFILALIDIMKGSSADGLLEVHVYCVA